MMILISKTCFLINKFNLTIKRSPEKLKRKKKLNPEKLRRKKQNWEKIKLIS